MQREASNLTIALIIGHVRDCAGDDGVARLLALADERRPLAELLDDARWSAQDQKIRLFEAAAILLDDPEVARRVGETVLRQQTGTAVRLMLRALGSPGALCRSVAKASAKFSTNYQCQAISVGRDEAVISNCRVDGLPAHRMDCDYTIGLLSQISAIFGLPPASVVHEECQVQGAPKCIYRLHWRSRYRRPWRARHARTEYLTEQLRLLTER